MEILSPEDLEKVFLQEKPKKRLPLPLLYVIFFLAVYLLFYIVANFPALWQKSNWWYKNEIALNESSSEPIVQTTNNGSTIVSNNIQQIKDNQIFIPKIGVTAPIAWNIKNVDAEMQKSLETSTAHILGTALPGQKGNGFITGHSSNYLWAKGSYKTIFSLLNKLVIGDQFMVKYQNQEYVYKIIKIVTVKPTDSEILRQNNKKNEFSLITCVPVGTSLYRLVTTGEQIYPKAR